MKSIFVFLVGFVVAVVSGNVVSDRGSRILGGASASIVEYPFAVAMLNELFSAHFLSANGIILTENSILSAARPYVDSDDNVQPSTRWRARVGTAYFAIGGTVLTIAHITIHPEFSVASSNTDDLAVIRTSTPILFTTSAARATLAHMDFGLPSGQDVAAVGWGLLRLGEVEMFRELLNVGLRLMDQTACGNALNETLTNKVICADTRINGAGPCTGNAGSALAINKVVLGIFSYNRECGNIAEPNVYVNVATYIHWISDVATGVLKSTAL